MFDKLKMSWERWYVISNLQFPEVLFFRKLTERVYKTSGGNEVFGQNYQKI